MQGFQDALGAFPEIEYIETLQETIARGDHRRIEEGFTSIITGIGVLWIHGAARAGLAEIQRPARRD